MPESLVGQITYRLKTFGTFQFLRLVARKNVTHSLKCHARFHAIIKVKRCSSRPNFLCLFFLVFLAGPKWADQVIKIYKAPYFRGRSSIEANFAFHFKQEGCLRHAATQLRSHRSRILSSSTFIQC